MTTYPEHPAVIHRRTVALVKQIRGADQEGITAILNEVYATPEIAQATLVSLAQLSEYILEEFAPDPDAWLDAHMLMLAASEGVGLPPDSK